MNQEQINYQRIAEAIDYIRQNYKQQPSLDEIAERINVSPFHFQKIFTDWAGVSPKKFLQFISLKHAKQLLQKKESTLFDVAFQTGLSGTSRLHDLFVSIEGMTPGEFKNGGENLNIDYQFYQSPFGGILIACTAKGICFMAFADDKEKEILNLKSHFPNAEFYQLSNKLHQQALLIFSKDWKEKSQLKLHLKGTVFQLKVWEALLKIPIGNLTTYGTIAQEIENPKASRAVGTAIGSNPVAFLIPCHRVIQSTGEFGGYLWGPTRKTAIIGWEAALQ
ncbi:MAG: methylated-DNA--[protein]-cysteine S-methyltransferase [Bacteroidetes bacterium]|nr:methylated-DNA--[protein]-cysteine S-methyltransferase [Bacteroidota bacterium]MBU1373116.1 methylated-DNA--[protein]-cysteine S-methyltransferase [Bacteroidota bacterium]MBU1484298.1 methylated-DNA--[protein]-cysteine S-methyltransferase [Bacteroidota bacterium]MBU1760255.1 methylated-DNA--[protein]-cysteine S-methyltransferase [Bacteroidota bacterium]MBU2267549.1 methylated-DNA--[protein]-cysteine S-methyltransferase [Bacteroidota bacterium]